MAGASAAHAAEATAPINPSSASDDRSKETFINAERMSFDQNTGIATATGHVEIARSGYILHADKITYDQNKDMMHAEGHVAMLMPDGEVQFADKEEVTGDMKQAFATNLSVLFPDNSRLVAQNGQRYEGRYMTADKGLYTACNVCKDDPDHQPLWQIRADKIVHDNETHDVYYHDATLDFLGLPVMYTPYASAPDPTVERRQGFLTPTPGYTPSAGAFVRTPYYFDIAPDKDAIFAPTFSTNDIAQLGGEYRERFERGSLQLDGNIEYADLTSENTGDDKGDRVRGNLLGMFRYDINNIWRAGADVDYASDKSYLQRYNLTAATNLTDRAYVEGFQGRDYAAVNTYYFQDLRPGTQPVQPTVLPEVGFNTLGEPGQTFGGRWSMDGSMLITARDNQSAALPEQGPETRRASLDGGWERQFVSDTGLLTTISGLLRGDSYWADNVIDPSGSGNVFNNVLLSRQFEQANVVFRYPMGRRGEDYEQILEPIAMLTAAPTVHTSDQQPIEDSLDLQFDYTNLFSPNRFTGTDLIEGGSRATYGLRNAFIADSGAHLDLFGGESYDFTPDNLFPTLSGLHDHASDYVGNISLSPGKWLDADYSFRISHIDFTPQMQDAHMSFGVPVFRPMLRYILAYQTETTGIVDTIEEGTIGFSSNFTKYWTFVFQHIQGFQPQPGARQTSANLIYTDECFIAGVTLERNDITRFDIKPGTSILFHVYLRNIGGLHTDSFSAPTFPAEFRQPE